MQHDRAREAPDGLRTCGVWASISSKPASDCFEGDSEAVDRGQPRISVGQRSRAARSNKPDIEAAIYALPQRKRRASTRSSLPATFHLEITKLKKSRQQVLDEACAAVTAGRQHCDDVEFSSRRRHPHRLGYLEQVSKARGGGGARTVNLRIRWGFIPGARRVRRADRQDGEGAGHTAIVSVHLPRRSGAGGGNIRWRRCTRRASD